MLLNHRLLTMKVLILCTGNSCRSQMAQGILQSFDKNLTVCSAGTEPASRVNPLAIEVMKEIVLPGKVLEKYLSKQDMRTNQCI